MAMRKARDEHHAARSAPPSRPPASAPRPGLAALQRSAGNGAVVQALRDTGRLQEETEQPDAGAQIKDVTSRGGAPLDPVRRAKAESVFKEDFSDVRLHTDTVAQRSAANVRAHAYTVGNNIVAGSGSIDDRTLFHELTHVSQQRRGPVAGTDRGDGVRVSDPGDPFERAASANERLADTAAPVQHHAGDGHDHGPGDAHAHGDAHGAPVQRSAARPATVQRVASPGEGPAEDAEQPRHRVLVVCDESGLGLGGVPVFNMELVKGLHHDNDVTMLTVNAREDYDHAKATSQHDGVRIVNASVPGVKEGRDRLDKVAGGSPDQYGLPTSAKAFDIVIGHSRFSGPAAQKIRDSWYPGARVVHFLHTSPVRLDKIKKEPKKGAEKAIKERKAMQQADLVAGVGTLLAKEAERLSEGVLRVPALHDFVPGTEVGTPVASPVAQQADGQVHLPRTLKVLLPGRASDEIKGVEAAVQAIGILRRPQNQGGRGLDVHMTIRGTPDPHEDPEKYAKWKAIVDAHGEGGVTMLPFSKNPADLEHDRETTHAVIMPSLHEGFGLVATEGAGRALPVLVNGESGAAQFLSQVTSGSFTGVVDAPFEVDSAGGKEVAGGADARAQAWAAAIEGLRSNLPGARAEAEELYELLKGYSWRHAAQALVTATMRTAPPLKDKSRREAEPHRGAVTRQGLGGAVEEVEGKRDNWAPHAYWDGSSPEPAGAWAEEEQLAHMKKLAVAMKSGPRRSNTVEIRSRGRHTGIDGKERPRPKDKKAWY
ncbi:eCIS core domain-containing protein [Streptomyces sp. CA2R106]|uniref:eCIS core domain-containing protein n=1 Tax=Streptomyces sp. CA2R106 TaxID=3120153 RepID=UPI0030098C4C